MDDFTARLFFGFQIEAAWPKMLPLGRLVAEKERHLTALFLGEQDRQKMVDLVKTLPQPGFAIGPAGIFTECLFFPKKHPRCIVWKIDWLTHSDPFFAFQKALQDIFVAQNIVKEEKRDFVPHVTISRPPFHPKEWQKTFTPLPVIATGLHLFESLGHSTYRSLWHMPFIEAYREIEHTADMAFSIRGSTIYELHQHAQLALASAYPPFIGYFAKDPHVDTLEDLISDLNALISHTDSTIGCPLKAVSYHGDIKQGSKNVLEWEMIIDV